MIYVEPQCVTVRNTPKCDPIRAALCKLVYNVVKFDHFNYGEYAIIGIRWLLRFLQIPTPWISCANKNVLCDNYIRGVVNYFANKM